MSVDGDSVDGSYACGGARRTRIRIPGAGRPSLPPSAGTRPQPGGEAIQPITGWIVLGLCGGIAAASGELPDSRTD
jgi:hypothetical protein